MYFDERKEFLYDPELFSRTDTQTALKLQHEYVLKCSCKPTPVFFEVSTNPADIDHLWHVSRGPRQAFRRELNIPCINVFEKPDWRLTVLGIAPQRRDTFWISNVSLRIDFNYFPCRGDMVYWNGYRYMIMDATVDPSAYWQQTNVWLGMVVHCQIVPEGDARPLADLSKTAPAERSGVVKRPEGL